MHVSSLGDFQCVKQLSDRNAIILLLSVFWSRMSIPPLVCSTPPPPDQCVDEKDHDDFGLQYNLSQEDEDDNYDYMGFSPYNHCQPQTPVKQNPSSVSKDSTEEPSVSHTKELHNLNGVTDFIQQDVPKDNIVSPSKTNAAIDAKEISNIEPDKIYVEDEIVEDLNLEVVQEIFSKKTGDQTNTFKNETEISCDVNISNAVNENIPSVNNVQEIDSNVITITTTNINDQIVHSNIQTVDQIDGPPTYIDELIENESININSLNSDNLHIEPTLPLTAPLKVLKGIENIPDPEYKMEGQKEIHDDYDTEVPKDNSSLHTNLDFKEDSVSAVDNDDFGDFDDFQFATTSNTNNNNPSTLVKDCDSENPWSKGNEATNDFGDFKANFNQENNESYLLSKIGKQTEIEHSNTENQIKTHPQSLNDDDDDFGDFDDFKSSTEITTDEQMHQQYPVLNLHSTVTETQIMESINKVLNSIFLDEITEQEMEYTKLESHVGVTWNHLLEVDTRQPYIVNWNNSLGQKTLLKALCIDSRNILFGPKWSQNMPKYATNLTAAPLQPLKQMPSSNETTAPANSASKTTWSDPFTAEGQESGTIGSSSDHPPLEIGPTDLDVFEAASSSKPDKIYSSAPNVQPIRQINLPETHIFTPTDSETPRSTTIHYDSPILLPQTAIGVTETVPRTTDSNIGNEYWEFQDYKSTASTQPEIQTTSNVSSEVAVGTQVLQPVKVEPTVPTLNWPDPGDIKETFENFSDFVSNSTWSDTQEIPAVKTESGLNYTEPTSNLTQTNVESVPKSEFVFNPMVPQTNIPETSTFDDEFDTFQSALPPKIDTSSFPSNSKSGIASDSSSSKVMSQPQPQMSTESDNQLPLTNQKSDVISFPNYSGPSKTPNVFLASNVTKVEPVKSSSIQPISLQPSLLQPMPATSTKNQNTSQILQPLSLESYSQINWPNPGIDLQDLSRFNPVETLNSLKSDLSANSSSKNSSPVHSSKAVTQPDDDWGDFVSSKPKLQPKKSPTFADDDEWSDFVSSPSVKPQNGLNTISLNVSTNVNVQKNKLANKNPRMPYDIPTLNYVTPKTNSRQYTTDRHFQNL